MPTPANINTLKAGAIIVADDSFNCMRPGEKVVCISSRGSLFVDCNAGSHYLNSQTKDESGDLIGFSTPDHSAGN